MTTNAEALEATLEAFGVEPRFAALSQLARSLAVAVDADPGHASLAREYRNCLLDLMEAADGGSDDFEDLVDRLAAMGDAGDSGP